MLFDCRDMLAALRHWLLYFDDLKESYYYLVTVKIFSSVVMLPFT